MTRPEARKLIGRLEAKLGYPSTTDGLGALIDVLIEHAPTEAAAKAVIAECQDLDRCPDVGVIKRIALSLRQQEHEPPWVAPTRGGCPHCHGLGFVSFTRLAYDPRHQPYQAACCRPCSCRAKVAS